MGDVPMSESNFHADAKYMDPLMTQYFKDAKFDERNRKLFAFASYIAGPGNNREMRKKAEKRRSTPTTGSTRLRRSPPGRSASIPRRTYAAPSSITSRTSSRPMCRRPRRG